MTTVIDLIRHGEPIGGSMYRGQLDHPLSDKGWRQMREAVKKHQPWDQIITSTLSRCADFSEELAATTGLPLVQDSRLMEIGFGEWEGKTANELEAEAKEAFFAFYDDPIHNTPPGAEPLEVFQQRVIAAWQDVLKSYTDQHILIVSHAGTMRVILSHCLQMPLNAMYRIHVPNAGISRLAVHGQGARVYPQLMFHAGAL